MSDFQVDGFKAPTNDEINSTEGRSKDEVATNISDKTLEVLRDVATSNDMVIITRPVNSVAFSHMKAGAVGKNMFVHGKSAASGTIAQGLIPVQSCISKAGADDNVDKIKTYNSENAHSIETSQHKFKEIEDKLKTLVETRKEKDLPKLDHQGLLKEAGIPAEAFDPLVSKVNLLDKNGNQLYIFEDDKGRALRDKDRNYVYAIKQDEKFKLVDINHNIINHDPEIPITKFKPKEIEVIGKPEIEIDDNGSLKIKKVLPITADIDVLAYGARVNLQEFDKIRSHSAILKDEKTKIIEASGLNLPDNVKDLLTNKEIDKALSKETDLVSKLPQDVAKGKEFQKLTSDLRDIELQREHLRGMGDGSDVALAITGHMRAEFRDKVEISHGSEQFNIHFTQPMDKEWVVIGNTGKVEVVKGEEELIKTFNKFKEQGLSMPPNPNWGWKLENGQYGIDKDLRKIHDKAGDLTLKLSGAGESQKQEIHGILDLKTKLGIESITEPRNDKLISTMKKDLSSKVEKYNDKYFEIPATTKADISKTKLVQIGPKLQLIKQQLAKSGLKDIPNASTSPVINKTVQKPSNHR